MRYSLCEARSGEELERIVNRLLDDGWRPAGGVAVAQSKSTSQWWYYQAVVRDDAPARADRTHQGGPAKPPATGLGDFD